MESTHALFRDEALERDADEDASRRTQRAPRTLLDAGAESGSRRRENGSRIVVSRLYAHGIRPKSTSPEPFLSVPRRSELWVSRVRTANG